MSFDFTYSHQAEKFVGKNSDSISFDRIEDALEAAIRKIRKIEVNSVDLIKMEGDWKGYWRVRLGSIRVVFRFEGMEPIIVYVEKIEFRGSVYRRN